MENFLYIIVELIARVHNFIMTWNDSVEYSFTDKELHFLVIGAMGLLMIFAVHPVFKWLAENGHIMVTSFVYVFTVIIVVTFAIEIGQRVTGTGNMDFADIAYGVLGFLAMFAVFAVIRAIAHLIWRRIYGHRHRDEDRFYR